MSENTAFDNLLGLFQGRKAPAATAPVGSDTFTDLTAAGSTTTVINLIVGGLQPNALVRRYIQIGLEVRRAVSNTASSITVDSSLPFTAAPALHTTVTILPNTFVYNLGFDVAARTELFGFGDFIEITNIVKMDDVGMIGVRVFMTQPKSMDEKKDYHVGLHYQALAHAAAVGSPERLHMGTPNSATLGPTDPPAGTHPGPEWLLPPGVSQPQSGNIALIANQGSVVKNLTPASGSNGVLVETAERHFVLPGDLIKIGKAVVFPAPIQGSSQDFNGHWRVKRLLSDVRFELDPPVKGSPGYVMSSAEIGLRERIYAPAGFEESDVGRKVTVNFSLPGFPRDFRILGIRKQPALTIPRQAWVERIAPVITSIAGAPAAGGQMVSLGARWMLSMKIENSIGNMRTVARVIPRKTQSPFWRADLKGLTHGLTGDKKVVIRLELIEDDGNTLKFYPN